MKIFITAFLPFLLASACSPSGMVDAPLLSSNFPPPGPPNYQQGMKDGCSTALSAIANSLLGVAHSGVHYDVNAALHDKVYYKAWKDGYFYCKYEHDKGPE